MSRATVTVVIPTFRRPSGLARCLAGLADQQVDLSWDVLVVDNDGEASSEATALTARAVEEFRARRPELPIRLVVESTQGAAHARNRGIAEAAGEVVAMLDDDVVPQTGWLGAICAPILAGAAAGAGGVVILDPHATRPAWLDDSAVGGYLTAFDLGPQPHDVDYFAELVVTANAAFRRETLLRVGGFDPAFGPRGSVQIVCDDAHLTRQVIRLGERVRWCPDAVVVHELPATRTRLRWLLRRAWWQGRSDWRLERLELLDRRFGGAWAGLVQVRRWLAEELRQRRQEGIGKPQVAVHAGCDLVRMMGRATEIAAEVLTRQSATS
jgi:GT2 family glycosyltransferase